MSTRNFTWRCNLCCDEMKEEFMCPHCEHFFHGMCLKRHLENGCPALLPPRPPRPPLAGPRQKHCLIICGICQVVGEESGGPKGRRQHHRRAELPELDQVFRQVPGFQDIIPAAGSGNYEKVKWMFTADLETETKRGSLQFVCIMTRSYNNIYHMS